MIWMWITLQATGKQVAHLFPVQLSLLTHADEWVPADLFDVITLRVIV